MTSGVLDVVICVLSTMCDYLFCRAFIAYRKLRRWQIHGRPANAVVTSKWKVVHKKDERKNKHFIAYSFKPNCRDREIAMQQVLIRDVALWQSMTQNANLEIVYVEMNACTLNKPRAMLADPCRVGTRLVLTAALCFFLFANALILHDDWKDILIFLFLLPGTMLLLIALAHLCCTMNTKTVDADDETNKLLDADTVKIVVY